METNTVILSVSKYDSFRDTERKYSELLQSVKDGNVIHITSYYSRGTIIEDIHTITPNEAIKALADKNNEYVKDLNFKDEKIASQKRDIISNIRTIEDLKRMSCSEFRRWRRQQHP